jgi:hypothetical protein
MERSREEVVRSRKKRASNAGRVYIAVVELFDAATFVGEDFRRLHFTFWGRFPQDSHTCDIKLTEYLWDISRNNSSAAALVPLGLALDRTASGVQVVMLSLLGGVPLC